MMKNLFRAAAPMLVLFSIQLAAQTNPNPSNNDLPFCETVKEKYQAELQEAANAESRTIFRCIDCLDRATTEKRCELIVVQPDTKKTGRAVVQVEPDASEVRAITPRFELKFYRTTVSRVVPTFPSPFSMPATNSCFPKTVRTPIFLSFGKLMATKRVTTHTNFASAVNLPM